MKKSVLVFSMTLLLLLSGLNIAVGQEQPKPKKDTVNMDTDAKPKFYYPVEDEKEQSKREGFYCNNSNYCRCCSCDWCRRFFPS